MIFEQEMKKYKSLSPEDRLKKVINLLELIKDKDKNLLETYNILKNNPNIESSKVDKIYKIILEGMIYQQSLDNKENSSKIKEINSSLKAYLEEERLEREKESKEAENLLSFS